MKNRATAQVELFGAAAGGLFATVLILGTWGCGMASTPVFVQGPGTSGNEPPTLTILEPITNLTRGQGDFIAIRWTDTDRDSNATISFALVAAGSGDRITIVQGIEENDTTGPDQITVGTSLIPIGTYNLVGVIDDGVNTAVETFASTDDAVPQRVQITIVGAGEGGSTVPPVITVTEPAFNQSVSQDDELRIAVQPTPLAPNANLPYDPDSTVTIYFLLDIDQNPNNDDPANPGSGIIVLDTRTGITSDEFDVIEHEETIDLAAIPPRPGGAPYYIRATIDDENNPRVHQYAVGAISVVTLAAGQVDLFNIGKTVSGARMYGFNPGAQVGTDSTTVGDFDADGVADFVVAAQFGNPRNFGLVGEAYLIYGTANTRFGGAIPVNSVGEAVSGVIFEAPPIRRDPAQSDGTTCRIEGSHQAGGITDVSFIDDLTGDGRPEILFGMPHVEGAYDGTDWDPGDQEIAVGDDNRTNITVTIRQREVTVQEDNGPQTVISATYSGVQDATIDSANPNLAFGSDVGLTWQDDGPAERKWALIKFQDILDQIPDSTQASGTSFLDVTSVTARLEFQVFDTGPAAEVFEGLTDFNQQITYGSFAVNGGDPQEGVDYLLQPLGQGDLGNIDASTPDLVNIDVTPVVQKLLNGLLDEQNEELRFIIIHGGEGEGEAAVRSSEFTNEGDRPSLIIEYDRVNLQGQTGCYPDNLPNNKTDANDGPDDQYYAGGAVIMLDSGNRDNSPRANMLPDRLDTTVVSLELIGQTPRTLDRNGTNELNGEITARADDYNRVGRILGARFVPGAYDCVDHRQLRQPARSGFYGQNVSSIGDLNNDGLDEIVISAPFNERYVADLANTFGPEGSHLQSTIYRGSIVVMPGANYSLAAFGDSGNSEESNSIIPSIDLQRFPPFGRCQPSSPREMYSPPDAFEVFAENIDDQLGGASSAGDFNQDGLDDLLCGAPMNDRSTNLRDSGAVYVLYGRNVLGDFDLGNANDPFLRTPMLRIRGESPGDQIGWRQSAGLDVNGDRIGDVFVSSPRADFGGIVRSRCAGDFNGDNVIDDEDLDLGVFNDCEGDNIFSDDACKAFDYDNDGDVDDDDRDVFFCLSDGGTNCCGDIIDNGFVGVIFGGVFTDGDRTISQIATTDLPGVVFYGSASGHRAGFDVSSAGDFNQDGFGDILITVPGEVRLDSAGRPRLGVVYLVFGGTHLYNTSWELSQVGSADLPGIIFISPYVQGRPNEAAPLYVSFIGDINRDGFGDIVIGNPKADFIDFSFPQGPQATDAELGRRRDAGDAYIIYGNNFGSNRGG